MQTLPSSETVLLPSNSPPVLRNPGGDDDVDIDFRDVFGGPPKRRSKVNEVARHSFSEAALWRRDVIVDNSALIPRDDFWDGRDERHVFGEDPSIRRRFTADDFFDDIFRVNESSSSSSPPRKTKNEQEPPGSSLPGSRILSPARPQFSLPAKLIKATEIPTFSSATRSLSKNKETASSSPLSRTSTKADMLDSTTKSDSNGYVAPQVVTGKGRQFHFSIYKWPNKGVPVIIWGSSRLSSMAKADETTPSDLWSTTFEKDEDGDSGLSGLMSGQAFSGNVSKAPEANVKPLYSLLDEKDERQGEDIVLEREVNKGKSKAKNMRSSAGDSRSKKKPHGTRSSLDSPMHDKSSFASTSSTPEVGKDGVKGKVMDFVKIFSQGASVGAGGESLEQSSRWKAKENPMTDANKDGVNAKETVNIPDQQKESTPDKPSMDQDQKPSQATQKKVPDRVSVNSNKPSGVTKQEERQKPSTAHTT